MRRALWAIVIAVPLVAVLAFGFGRNPDTIASPLLHHRMPAFRLLDLDGRPVSSSALRGKVVVINFWASWCLECKTEHSALVSLWEQYHDRGVVLLGVVYEDSPGSARRFIVERGGWANLQDPTGRMAIDFGVYGVPETFFVDEGGIVSYKQIGPVTPELLRRHIAQLVGGGA